MFDLMASSIEQIKAGRIRALAVTTAARAEALPDLPTVADFVPGYEASAVGGIGAPKGTPPVIVETLNSAINAALADPSVKARYAQLGSVPLSGSPSDYRKLVAVETEKWAKVIEAANIKPQ
jgi:tripartite-type tricarboxylate transporter receptor subunit TctC